MKKHFSTKKLLSMILAFAMVISCFASLSIINVSAHQNYKDQITFDEIDDFNVTGYKFGTGNFTREEGKNAGSLEKYSTHGKLTNFHYSNYSNIDVATAPDARYGKSLGVLHSVDPTGSTNPYVQVSYTPGGNSVTKLYGTMHVTASLYVEEAPQYVQRGVLFRTTESSSYRKYPVMFDYGTGRRILIFDKDCGKKYSPAKWYDFDILYNNDTKEYQIKIFEDGELFYEQTGIDPGTKYSYCDSVILYHGNINSAYQSQYCYWDNFLVETTNEFTISQTASSKEVWDFENFEQQDNSITNVGMPVSSRGTWSLGYQGSTKLEIVKSVTDEKTDDMEVAPNLGKSIAFGNFTAYEEATAIDGKNDYLYPQFRYHFNTGTWAKKFQVSFSARFIKNGTLNLYMKGSNQCNIFRADGHNLYIFGVRDKTFTFNATDWFDINILMDGATGFYTVEIKNRTSPSKPSFYTEAYNPDIVTKWATTEKIIYLQEGTGAGVKYVYLDNLYWGTAYDEDFTKTTDIADVQAEATAEAEATATVLFPFVDTYAGKYVTANLTFEGTAPTFTLGTEAIDISALTPGTYPVVMKLLNGETDSVTLSINGTDYPVSLTALPSSLTLTSPAGEGNKVSFTDVVYSTMNVFEITNDFSAELFDPDDDVVINFSTPLVNPSADGIKVYKPAGTLSANSEITDKTVTFAEDGKSVTIAFDKAYDTHYHITLDGLTDIYGSTLSDFAEFDTQLPDLIMSNIRFFRGEGENEEALTLLTPGEVKASMNITANNNTDFELLFALGLYQDDKLMVVKSTMVDATSAKSEPVLSLTVPNDGKEYVVKAFAWKNSNAKPMFKTRVLAPTTDEPIAIIKMDDFGSASGMSIWQEVEQWAKDQDVKVSYGLMGYTINQETAGKSHAAAVAELANSPMVEVWCHGYDWKTGPFTSSDETVQANEFAESNRVAEEAGFEMHAFNPPSNGMNAVTAKVLNEQFPNYTTVMVMSNTKPSFISEDDNFTTLWQKITTETTATSVTDAVDDLKARWNTAKENGYEYIVIQMHPQGWTGNRASQERFYEFVYWLRDQGVVFMHPSEYTAYINAQE